MGPVENREIQRAGRGGGSLIKSIGEFPARFSKGPIEVLLPVSQTLCETGNSTQAATIKTGSARRMTIFCEIWEQDLRRGVASKK